jgi:transposase-like protein
MNTLESVSLSKGYRFPSVIISHFVWRSFRFALSFRDSEELMAKRGIILTSETLRQWCLKFGQTSANELRRRRPCCGDKWHRDEVSLRLNGKPHSLWRAVDQHGDVLDIQVAESTQQACCENVLPQAAQRAPVCAPRDHDRYCQLSSMMSLFSAQSGEEIRIFGQFSSNL